MKTIFKVGTSGYNYFWNKGKSNQFQWYIDQKFNTVEINATFYSFPFKSWIMNWKKAPDYFDFSIKVNKRITHFARLSKKGIEIFKKFKSLLTEIEDKIAFWLFQMPPTFVYNEKNLNLISNFFTEINLDKKVVIEFRNVSWWENKDEIINLLKKLGVIFCSIDAPELPNDIIKTLDIIYLRIHGRKEWYHYIYSEKELNEIVNNIRKLNPLKCYIYLNNDHGMLPNGKYLLEKFEII